MMDNFSEMVTCEEIVRYTVPNFPMLEVMVLKHLTTKRYCLLMLGGNRKLRDRVKGLLNEHLTAAFGQSIHWFDQDEANLTSVHSN